MLTVVYIRKPVGNGWSIVKAIKIPPAMGSARSAVDDPLADNALFSENVHDCSFHS